MASNLGSADTTAPYLISWNSALASNGSHTILAEARDAANNVSTTSVVVNVSNGGAPTLALLLDFDGSDDYARVADADALSFGNGTADTPLTIEAWIRPDAWPASSSWWASGARRRPGLRVQVVCRVDGPAARHPRPQRERAGIRLHGQSVGAGGQPGITWR